MGHVIHVLQERDSALMQLDNIVYYCTSCDARWTSRDHILQIAI